MAVKIKIECAEVESALTELSAFKYIFERMPDAVQSRLFSLIERLIFCDVRTAIMADSVGKLTLSILDGFELLVAALRARDGNAIGDIELITHIESLCEKYSC